MSRTGWVVLGLVTLGLAAGGVTLARRKSEPAAKFRKQAVDRGDVVATVTASGTLSAVTTVKVGSQVSGIISALHADFNSEVRAGDLLAELDPSPFQASVEQRQADVQRAESELRKAELDHARTRRLFEERILSQGEYDASSSLRDSASAGLKQSRAALDQALVNLRNTRITSPIDGVVVDRQYDVGQTVAASFQAPTLFTIAKDLTKMQVVTNIDEADIGGVAVSQPATFTVDAFPDATFRGAVSQVRLSPQNVQNVVTYPVVIDVDNPEGRLRPGMTANVSIPVQERRGVLRVPNAALRFKPDPALVKKPAGAPGGAAPDERGGPRGPGGRGGGAGARGPSGRTGVAHVETPGGKLRAVAVTTSITDGTFTAIEDGALNEGDEVVTGLATAKAAPAGAGQRTGGMRGPRM